MSIAPLGYSDRARRRFPCLPSGVRRSRPADDTVKYEYKSVQALRGKEDSAKAKWQNQGWEFVSESRGKLRTELNFRRVKPKTVGAYLLSFVAAFRRMQPKTQLALIASGALILVAASSASLSGHKAATTPPIRARRRPRLRPRQPAEPADTSAT